MCCHLLRSKRRRRIGVAILSMLIYLCFISIACEFSLRAELEYRKAREDFGKPTKTPTQPPISDRLQQFDVAKDEQLTYLFWTWMAILFALTFCVDALVFFPATIFKSQHFAHLYLVTISMFYVLNLTPLMFVLDIDTNGKSSGRYSLYWFGWLTAVIFIHRILNSVVVWFLMAEVDRGLHDRRRPSSSSQLSAKSSQINPLTPPNAGFLHHPYQVEVTGDQNKENSLVAERIRRQSQSSA